MGETKGTTREEVEKKKEENEMANERKEREQSDQVGKTESTGLNDMHSNYCNYFLPLYEDIGLYLGLGCSVALH